MLASTHSPGIWPHVITHSWEPHCGRCSTRANWLQGPSQVMWFITIFISGPALTSGINIYMYSIVLQRVWATTADVTYRLKSSSSIFNPVENWRRCHAVDVFLAVFTQYAVNKCISTMLSFPLHTGHPTPKPCIFCKCLHTAGQKWRSHVQNFKFSAQTFSLTITATMVNAKMIILTLSIEEKKKYR